MILLIDDLAKAPKLEQKLSDKNIKVEKVSLFDVQYNKTIFTQCDLIIFADDFLADDFAKQYCEFNILPYILLLEFNMKKQLDKMGVKKLLPIPLDTSCVNVQKFIQSFLPKDSKILLVGQNIYQDFSLHLQKAGYVVDFLVNKTIVVNTNFVAYLQDKLQSLPSAIVVLLDVLSCENFFAVVDKQYLTNCSFFCLSPQVAEVCLVNGFSNFIIADDFNVVGLTDKIIANCLG